MPSFAEYFEQRVPLQRCGHILGERGARRQACLARRLPHGQVPILTQSWQKATTGRGPYILGRSRPQGQWTAVGFISNSRTLGVPGAGSVRVRASRLVRLVCATSWRGFEPFLWRLRWESETNRLDRWPVMGWPQPQAQSLGRDIGGRCLGLTCHFFQAGYHLIEQMARPESCRLLPGEAAHRHAHAHLSAVDLTLP